MNAWRVCPFSTNILLKTTYIEKSRTKALWIWSLIASFARTWFTVLCMVPCPSSNIPFSSASVISTSAWRFSVKFTWIRFRYWKMVSVSVGKRLVPLPWDRTESLRNSLLSRVESFSTYKQLSKSNNHAMKILKLPNILSRSPKCGQRFGSTQQSQFILPPTTQRWW